MYTALQSQKAVTAYFTEVQLHIDSVTSSLRKHAGLYLSGSPLTLISMYDSGSNYDSGSMLD